MKATFPPTRPRRNVLAIGAHPDDIELGCAGALAKHVRSADAVTMFVVTAGEKGPGKVSCRRREQERAAAKLGVHDLHWGRFRDTCVAEEESDLVQEIGAIIKKRNVDIVYTHSPDDTHQDHGAVARATLAAARQCANVLFYEAPSCYRFAPTVYVDISSTLRQKLAALRCHRSQVLASSMASPSLVRNAAGFHGHHARVLAAEGFLPHRLLLPVGS